MESKAYTWDTEADEVSEIVCDIPDGATPRQALVLFDDVFNTQEPVFDKKIRQVGGVWAMDSVSSPSSSSVHYYWCPEDAEAAKSLAESEMQDKDRR